MILDTLWEMKTCVLIWMTSFHSWLTYIGIVHTNPVQEIFGLYQVGISGVRTLWQNWLNLSGVNFPIDTVLWSLFENEAQSPQTERCPCVWDIMERLERLLAELHEKSTGGRIISREALWSQFWKYHYLTRKDKIQITLYL